MRTRRYVLLATLLVLVTVFCLPVSAASAETATTTSRSFTAQPTVVYEIASADGLDGLSDELPASVIFGLDEQLNAIATDGSTLGSFAEMLTRLDGKIMPIVKPTSLQAVTALQQSVSESSVADLAIMSSDLSLLIACANIRARMYYETSIANVTAAANAVTMAGSVGAHVIVLNEEDASPEVVRYLQSRIKSVWLRTSADRASVANAVGYGAYGIVSSHLSVVQDVFDIIAAAEGKNVVSRAPFVVAHRGCVLTYSENTLGAIVEAAQFGATHVEIDVWLTKDNEIVILHDEGVSGALKNPDGSMASGKIGEMTLAQLKQLIHHDGESRIATLDEVFEVLDQLGIILVVEFKSTSANLITEFQEKVAEYNVASRLAAISFHPMQITRLQQQCPNIPSSLLLYTMAEQGVLSQAFAYNAVPDMMFNGNGGVTSLYGDGTTTEAYNHLFRCLADRGYPLWMWTYYTDSMNEALYNGVTGITTDDCWSLTKKAVQSFAALDSYAFSTLPKDGDTVSVDALTYDGEKITVEAEVRYLDEESGLAILIYNPQKSFGLISHAVVLTKKTGGCGGDLGANSVLIAVGLIGLAFLLMGKRARAK